MTCLDYLSEYDEFLKLHLQKYGNSGQGKANYLSHHICDEFIEVIGKRIETEIVNEIKAAKYFSLVLDSSPDIAHTDQLTFILRYVMDSGKVVEIFIAFIPIDKHDASYLEVKVLEMLQTLDLNIENCRGQTYDNGAHMAGKYKGLQARIKNLSPSATFIPCANHSLNLVGNFAAENCNSAVN